MVAIATIIHGDCLKEMRKLPPSSFHACVTDPPYGLNFMGKSWDAYNGGVAFQPDTWRAVYDLLIPGSYLAAFGGTRTSHRMTCAIEDAGFEICDTVAWLYGSGFPVKSHNISKAIDKAAGAVRKVITVPATPEATQWKGWGTALKPGFEPIIVAQKPFKGSIAENVLKHGVGGINIDACRVGGENTRTNASVARAKRNSFIKGFVGGTESAQHDYGRWPANVLHDGSDEVMAAFAVYGEKKAGVVMEPDGKRMSRSIYGATNTLDRECGFADTGTAARFFYTAKADRDDRVGSKHPTVKPTDLMRWLVELFTPVGGQVIDPFMGTGSTILAAQQHGFDSTGIELDFKYFKDARNKVQSTMGFFANVHERVTRRVLRPLPLMETD